MDFNAVYHQASDNYCYPLNEDELIINIKTGCDVESVSIIQGDPFAAGILGGGEHWDGAEEAIIYKKRLKNQIWWTTTVRPEFKLLINCCEEDIEVEHQGEILLARHYIDSTLLSNGVLIRRIHK